ncbi:MAG TPA: NAD-dependent epimerase/dehydratase family protein [bacterium]|nr:NAD-dependent epimerase/dehydratase family protein [bacterium]
MAFLITGGAGFIGSHLGERLLRLGYEVVVLDNFNDYYNPDIKQRNIEFIKDHSSYTLVKGDILDWDGLNSLFKKHSIEGIIHLAARAGVRPSIEQPRLYQKVNVEGTVNLLEAACRYRVPKFLLASSSSVYGNNTKVPFSETDSVDHPVSPYAATKKACELIAYTYHSMYKIPVTCLRFFTVYGPRQRPDMAIHKFTAQMVRGEEILMFGDGSTQRDYTYIDDIIQGLEQALNHCTEGYKIYNLGESRTIRLMDLINLLEKALDKPARIKKMPLQKGDVKTTYADISLAQKELEYSPRFSIEEGISRFVSWYCKELGRDR